MENDSLASRFFRKTGLKSAEMRECKNERKEINLRQKINKLEYSFPEILHENRILF